MHVIGFRSLSAVVSGGSPVAGVARWLTFAERAELRTLPEAGRRDWYAARVAAKRAAAAVLKLPEPRRLEIRRSGRAAAPRAALRAPAGALEPTALSLSLAHRDGRAVAAACRMPSRVGIDLERAGSVSEEQLRYFATPAERGAFRGRDATVLWALKEAAWKALECGDDVAFTALELGFDRSGGVRTVSVEGRRLRCSASVTRPWLGYVCAVVRVAGGAR